MALVSHLFPSAEGHLIAIGRKTSRGSGKKDGGALHTVSAYAGEARLILAQMATEKKSNEISAILGLLDLRDLKGAVVSIGGAGSQKVIAESILAKGGDYVLALKGNQRTLHDCTKTLFESSESFADTHEESNAGHGRIKTRRCEVLCATPSLAVDGVI